MLFDVYTCKATIVINFNIVFMFILNTDNFYFTFFPGIFLDV